MKNYRYKQKGVVLLTCLVFLLVLLGILRFVIGSAKLEEEKAGIDIDIFTAREAAQSAISYAEYFILRQGKLYCDKPDECNEAASANMIFNDSDADLKNRKKVGNKETGGFAITSLDAVAEKGLYTGTYIRNNAASCQPLWICVNWGNSAVSVDRSAKARGKPTAPSLASIECEECSQVNNISSVKPRFIIERYTTDELKSSGMGSLAANASGSVVFRITAVGFGKGTGKNLTNVMLQSTYVIPK